MIREMEDIVPSEFYLGQNSPNPFKEMTKIKYCLPLKTKVNLNLFNSNGDKVKELLNNIQEAGTYEVKFDAHNVPDGDYYYQLQAVDPDSSSKQVFAETKKMILLK